MKIETYCLAPNEGEIMPYFMRHYSQFSKVILLAHCCTDRTIEIAQSMGAEIRELDMSDEINQFAFLEIKERCWKGSTADWVIVVDADEFVYGRDLMGYLNSTIATVIEPRFHNMFSEVFPTTEGQIYDEVTMGMDGDFWLTKMNVFRPSEVERMNWAVGCHHAWPTGNIVLDSNSPLKTLHMRFIGRDFVMTRHKAQAARLNAECKEKGYGIQFQWSREELDDYWNKCLPKLYKVI